VALVPKELSERRQALQLSQADLGRVLRVRRLGAAAERARKSVNGRIGMTLGRMHQVHPDLARHLGASVRTGTFCVYAPEQRTIRQL
jgi:hypothetical protein